MAGGVVARLDETAGVSLGSDIRAYFSDKSNETATLLHVDADKDLSLLKIARSQHAGNAVSFFTEPTVPEMDVVMLSFFKMDDSHVVCPGMFEGKIVGPQDTPRGPQEQEDAPKHECVRSNYIARPGTSGAPVFSNSRLLVGVHVWHAYEFSYAVSVPTIITALRGWLQPPNENDSIYSMLRSLASPQAVKHTHMKVLPARDVVSSRAGHDHDRQLFWENDTCLVAGWLSCVLCHRVCYLWH